MHVDAFAPGTFCWNELASRDAPAARRFYTALFGWTPVDNPIPGDGVYTMLQKDGRDVCALFGARGGQPSAWSSFVAVRDVDASAAVVLDAGGALVVPPFDVLDATTGPGRMCVAADPAGATFSLWQARAHAGAGVVREDASVVWNELATPDPRGAASFYARLFGWIADVVVVRPTTSSPTTYTSFFAPAPRNPDDDGARRKVADGDPPRTVRVAGALGMNEAWEGVPPHWSTYFGADDVDAVADRARALGGKLLVAPFDTGVGRLATIADPGGAVFSVLTPPRS